MDTDLLRSWLDLPPGGWPPADRELLGVEAATPELAERRAMQLMSRLRPHQLLHPDLVTEGMNRLAQAMLAVANHRPTVPPAVPPRVPAPPGGLAPTLVMPKSSRTLPPAFGAFDLAPTQPPPAAPRPATTEAKPPPAAPVILDAEVVEDEPDAPIGFARFEQLDEPPAARPASPAPAEFAAVPEVELPDLPLPPGLSGESRRLVYRQVAALRELLRAWASLRTPCGNPREDFDTPGRVYGLGVAVAQFQAALRHPGYDADYLPLLAPRVFAVFRQASPLAVLRLLSLPQRRLLARDWALGQSRLAGRELAMRNSLRRTRPGGTIAQHLTGVGRFFAARPEAALAPPVAILVLIAVAKWLSRTAALG